MVVSRGFGLLLCLLLCPDAARAGDWLDVRITGFKAVNAKLGLQDGDLLHLECAWWLVLADDHSLWTASKQERFPVRILAGGQVIGEEDVIIHAGTEIIQDRDTGFLGAPEFHLSPGGTVKATWTAKGPGFTTLECVANEPKQISDQYKGNNRKSFQVSVTPAVHQPKNTWPSPEPKLKGTRRLPKTVEPAVEEKPDAGRRLPKAGLGPAPTGSGSPTEAPGTPARAKGRPGS